MIFGDRPHREAREADKATSEHASGVAVFPLAIPMMAGARRDRHHDVACGRCRPRARLAIIIADLLAACLLGMLRAVSASLPWTCDNRPIC